MAGRSCAVTCSCPCPGVSQGQEEGKGPLGSTRRFGKFWMVTMNDPPETGTWEISILAEDTPRVRVQGKKGAWEGERGLQSSRINIIKVLGWFFFWGVKGWGGFGETPSGAQGRHSPDSALQALSWHVLGDHLEYWGPAMC